MGLASSQARFLSLTARMHDIEYKAQKLEAQKLQMANQSAHVYAEYEEALNKTKIQYQTIGSDGSGRYVDASVKTLVTNTEGFNYIIHNIAENKMYCTEAQINKFIAAADRDAFAAAMGSQDSESYKVLFDEMQYCVSQHGGDPKKAFLAVDKTTGDYAPNTAMAQNFANEDYLTNMINAGFIVLHKMNSRLENGEANEVNVATDTALREVSDEVALKKAEAKYEADMRKINAKDKAFDVDIAALEQERNAIKTEMDTLKTVAKDNVDRTFKLFS